MIKSFCRGSISFDLAIANSGLDPEFSGTVGEATYAATGLLVTSYSWADADTRFKLAGKLSLVRSLGDSATCDLVKFVTKRGLEIADDRWILDSHAHRHHAKTIVGS